ncbi:grpb/dephospho-CoA kinase [Aspergillus pseudonomiae]|uniref:Grpb/dephospho-CoA kinase n=1 Tax=Aspergillus pseudonomiae TaxID=1506151 RepID=A0A5N7DBE0_9EURO|nr:grpb/dephospho-CoA kinase [Aspergillus pseudonomiae]KAB8261195.1 grpb/dephospho-CoA kinase [Aspergillus pseudonomiae]KAE8403702.1 grpb/dephospho-CoA kinase [Aspergillus pseudonomiae]
MASTNEITKSSQMPPGVEVVSTRPQKLIEIVEPDPTWPESFANIARRIADALGNRLLSIEHVGSTSVPGLPAKAVIDVDVVVADPTAEDSYVPALETAGFQFLLREPGWHEHRLFGFNDPYANIHIFSPNSAELIRHRLFRDWLRNHEDDRRSYADVKRQAAAASRLAGETVMEYNARKEFVILDILQKVFKEHEYVNE